MEGIRGLRWRTGAICRGGKPHQCRRDICIVEDRGMRYNSAR